MKRALVTLAAGDEFERLAEIGRPSFEEFADRHGYELVTPTLSSSRAPSWWKVPALSYALQTGYDEALWVDADMVIVDPSADLPVRDDAWQALVRHHTGDGDVPNCGLWLVRQPMVPLLDELWKRTQWLNSGWWEQAALMDMMGWRMEPRPVALANPSVLFGRTDWLHPGWNVHMWDTPGAEHPRVMHATMHPDRETVMRAWAAGDVPEPLASQCLHRYPLKGCYCEAAA